MANKTINELNSVTPSSTSKIPIYEGGGTGKATAAEILRTQDILFADDDQEPTSAVSFESVDTELTPASSESVQLLNGSDTWGSRFYKISQMFKNIRYLFSKTNNLETELNKKLPLKQWSSTLTTTNAITVSSSVAGSGTLLTSITVPETGAFIVSYYGYFQGTSTVGFRQTGWGYNDSAPTVSHINKTSAVGAVTNSIGSHGNNVLNLNAGDVLKLYAKQNSGSDILCSGAIFLTKLSDNLITAMN